MELLEYKGYTVELPVIRVSDGVLDLATLSNFQDHLHKLQTYLGRQIDDEVEIALHLKLWTFTQKLMERGVLINGEMIVNEIGS